MGEGRLCADAHMRVRVRVRVRVRGERWLWRHHPNKRAAYIPCTTLILYYTEDPRQKLRLYLRVTMPAHLNAIDLDCDVLIGASSVPPLR